MLCKFSVLSASAEERLKGGLFGAIGGSYFAEQQRLPESERDKSPVEVAKARGAVVEAEIWASRPCLVCFGKSDGPVSPFIDCFAAAMLLNPEPPTS
jgi:hypothetical protein